ncbi:type IV pilin protein [Pseudazoarcus pumilus]|nr:type IV pilin protein [Pseudazoarcus pumilus]
MTRSARRRGGFSLIELMITVAILAIIVAIAWPTYTEQIRKSRRVEAQRALLELAHHLEREFSRSGSYANATLPFDRVPFDIPGPYYTIAFVGELQADSWTLVAQPVGVMRDDPCGSFYVTHTGRRAQGDAPSNPLDPECWSN